MPATVMRHKVFPTRPGKKTTSRDESSTGSSVQSVIFFYLAFNCTTSIFRAYASGDMSMVAFIIFVYLSYFYLGYSLAEYNRLPVQENSPRKKFLKITIWGLGSAILFGFAYQFSTFTSAIMYVPMYATSVASSAFLFYIHFVYAEKPCSGLCCGSEKITSSGFCCPCGYTRDEHDILSVA